jgi:hypothetical protein
MLMLFVYFSRCFQIFVLYILLNFCGKKLFSLKKVQNGNKRSKNTNTRRF